MAMDLWRCQHSSLSWDWDYIFINAFTVYKHSLYIPQYTPVIQLVLSKTNKENKPKFFLFVFQSNVYIFTYIVLTEHESF